MADFFTIGALRIPISWVFIGLALVVAYVSMKQRLKNAEYNRKLLIDTVFSALFYGMIVWKLSYAIFNPIYTIKYPMGLLYFNGGQKGIFLGFLIAIIYLYFQSRKQSVSIVIYLELVVSGLLAGFATYSIYLLPSNFIFYSGQILLGFLLAIFLAIKGLKIGVVRNLINVLLIYCLGQIFLQYFSNTAPFLLGLTLIQILFIIVTLLLILIPRK